MQIETFQGTALFILVLQALLRIVPFQFLTVHPMEVRNTLHGRGSGKFL